MKVSRYIWLPITFLLLISLVSVTVYLYQPTGTGEQLFLSTTTSVRDSGLLDFLISEFEKVSSTSVIYTAIGSGAAIQLARDGEVDAVLVHAPELENQLIADGYVINKTILWYNFFIIVGPSSDPANIMTATNVSEVFSLIATAGRAGTVNFYSRGDNSGTHQKEQQIWQSTGFDPDAQSSWYYETGSGMSATLVQTNNDIKGYTISDLGTFATLSSNSNDFELKELFAGDELLFNPYSYLIIDESRTRTKLNTQASKEFLSFLTLESTNQLVRDFTIGNVILFTPISDREA